MNADSPNHSEHLTEDERQAMADGTLSAERAPAAARHITRCSACADDVARIREFLMQAAARDAGPADVAAADAGWPSVRARIDQLKEAPLAPLEPVRHSIPATRRTAGNRGRIVAGIAAAACVAAIALGGAWLAFHRAPSAPRVAATAAGPDSVDAYQEEARTLLDELELRRAMIRPDALNAIEHDLVVVDSAIVELRAAVARDPNNPALRQLLASTYRQKIEILKRMENAG